MITFTTAGPGIATLERAEALTMEEYLAAASPADAAALGLATRWLGSALLVRAATADVIALNRVVGLGTLVPARQGDVEAIVEEFDRHGVARGCVQVVPGAQPAGLTGWLEERGFVRHNRWVRLVRRTDRVPPPPSGVTVDTVRGADASVFAAIVIGAFGFPDTLAPWLAATVGRRGWHHYLARVDGEAVGGAVMFVHDGLAHFGFAGTRAGSRGRGAQSALIGRRLADAAALGCSHALVETAEDTPEKPAPSFRNVCRLGFEPRYFRDNWVRPRGA